MEAQPPNQPNRSNNHRASFVPAILSAAIWWIVPVIILVYPRGGEDQGGFGLFAFGILALAIAVVVCVVNRAKEWCVVFWMPPAALGTIASFYGISQIVQESGAMKGNMAPLAGVALLVGMGIAAILIAATVSVLVFHPKSFRMGMTLIALLNTVAIGFAVTKTDYQASKQEFEVHILDFDGRPISDATLKYERFGYGAGGKHVPEGNGDAVVSDAQGIARPHMKRMRHELKGVIEHPQYRRVHFTLGMQYSKWDTNRHLGLGTEETPTIIYGSVSVKEPVSIYIYLPLASSKPDRSQIKKQEVSTKLAVNSDARSSLNIQTGAFVSPPEGDLRFELYFEPDGQYKRARLRIDAENGAGIVVLPSNISFSEPLPSPERLYEIAPKDGYSDQVTILEPGSSPGPKLFVSSRDGKTFSMFTLDLYTNRNENAGRCQVKLTKNIAGGRELE